MIDQLPAYLSYVLGDTLADLVIWLMVGTLIFTVRRIFTRRYTGINN